MMRIEQFGDWWTVVRFTEDGTKQHLGRDYQFHEVTRTSDVWTSIKADAEKKLLQLQQLESLAK